MPVFVHLFIVTMVLASHVTWCTNHDVQCDPDIPSRPRPESGVPGVAMAQGDDQESECDEGEFLDWFKCSPCEYGTYRTKQMARENRYSRCQKCHSPGMYEIETEPCTSTRDAKIMCEDGFYRYEAPGKPCQSQCSRCDICGVGRNMFNNFEVRECGDYSNTVCCLDDNMVVVDGRCVAMTTTTKKTTTTATSQTFTTKPTKNKDRVDKIESSRSFPQTSNSCTHACEKLSIIFLALCIIFHVAANSRGSPFRLN